MIKRKGSSCSENHLLIVNFALWNNQNCVSPARMRVCLCLFVSLCIYVCFLCICVCLCVFLCVCVYLCVIVCICVFLHLLRGCCCCPVARRLTGNSLSVFPPVFPILPCVNCCSPDLVVISFELFPWCLSPLPPLPCDTCLEETFSLSFQSFLLSTTCLLSGHGVVIVAKLFPYKRIPFEVFLHFCLLVLINFKVKYDR